LPGELNDQESSIRLPRTPRGSESLAERVAARHQLLGGDKASDPEVRTDLGSLGVKVGVNSMGDDSGMNVQAGVVGPRSKPDFAAIRGGRPRPPQAQVVPLQESIQHFLERQILTAAKQIKV
jgi:hypothetical protein